MACGLPVVRERTRQPRALCVGRVERRILHAERLPDIGREIIAEPLAGDLLDDGAEHVDREAIFELGAGLVHQRQLGDALDEGLSIALDRRRGAVGIEPRQCARAVGTAAIHQAGGVAIEIVDEDRLRLRLHLQRAVGLLHADLHVGERRIELGDLGLQWQLALLHQRQARDRRHRLGHRRQREHRIDRHRRALHRIELAIRLVMHELAVARDRHHRAGHALGRDLAREEVIEPRQPLLRETDLVRRRFRERRGVGDADSKTCGGGSRGNDGFSHCFLTGDRGRFVMAFVARSSQD